MINLRLKTFSIALFIAVVMIILPASADVPVAFANSNSNNSNNGPHTNASGPWHVWHEHIRHQPTPGTGCFEAKYPNGWQRTACVPPVSYRETPSTSSETVGAGSDYIAGSLGGPISVVEGTFPSVDGLTSETDSQAGANNYSLQINSEFGFPTIFDGNPTTGWQQFIFTNTPSGGKVWIEYWLLDYSKYLNGGSCSHLPIPSGVSGAWDGPDDRGSCIFNTDTVAVPYVPATDIGSLDMEGFANVQHAGTGNDEAVLCILGRDCYVRSEPASFLNLSQNWFKAEFNVFGLGNGSQAQFNPGTFIQVSNALTNSKGFPTIACSGQDSTAETNNLDLWGCDEDNINNEIDFTEIAAADLNATTCNGQGYSWNGASSTCTVTGTVIINNPPSSPFLYIPTTLIINNNAAFEIDAGVMIRNAGAIKNNGVVANNGSDISNGGTIDNYVDINNNFGSFINDGEITNNAGGYINNSGASFYNKNNAIINSYGTINNKNTIINQNGGIIHNNAGAINNGGDIGNGGNIYNDGSINNDDYIYNYDTIDNGDTINNNLGGVINNSGKVINFHTIHNHYTINNNDNGSIDNTDELFNEGDGTINNNYGGVIKNSAPENFINYGTINNNVGGSITNAFEGKNATIINYGTINNSGIINSSRIDNGATIINYGTINNLCGGTITGNAILGNPVQNVCTPIGRSVTVNPVTGVSVTFETVTAGGDTTVSTSTSNPGSNPAGFQFLGTYYDITTTATYTPPVTVCLSYDPGMTFAEQNALKIFHWDSTIWADVTTSVDTTNHKVCGQANSLSPFGIAAKLGSILGTKFNDINGNGVLDPGKSGLANWTITLTNQSGVVTTVLTNASGYYSFTNLTDDNYTIGEVMQPGWIQTAPSVSTTGSGTYQVQISGGNDVTGDNFGNFKLGSVSGMKWEDLNTNHIKDENETGLSGWGINLIGNDAITNQKVNISKTTDENGNFSFDNLSAGTYVINENMQAGWIQTTPENGTYTVDITSGSYITEKDFGNFHKGNITGGGLISGTNGTATFGLVGLYPDNLTAQGSVAYNSYKLNIKSIQINTVASTLDKKKGVITGLATINGKGSYPFEVYIEDNAEPGIGVDVFKIYLSTYSYSNGGVLSRGNIQIHS